MNRSGFKTLDRVEDQGAGRRKSAAYAGVCEHFLQGRGAGALRPLPATQRFGVRWGFETTSSLHLETPRS